MASPGEGIGAKGFVMTTTQNLGFEHAWRHFQVHSSQRMLNWQYAISFSAVIYGAIAAGLEFDAEELVRAASALGVAATFAFWNLDRRTRRLVHGSERALKDIEASLDRDASGALTIFANTERKGFWELSYTQAFFILFACNAVAMTALGYGNEIVDFANQWLR